MSTQLGDAPARTAGVTPQINTQPAKCVRLFLSYSHRNKNDREALDRFLRYLDKVKLIEYFWDGRMDPGDPWPQEIMDKLEQADIVVLLLTQDFLDSDNCLMEAREALKLIPKGKIVIPVQVEATIPPLSDLRLTKDDEPPLWQRNAIPRDNPIRSKGSVADYTEVADELYKLVGKIRAEKGLNFATLNISPPDSNIGRIPAPPVTPHIPRPDPTGRDIAAQLARALKPPKEQVVVLHGPFGVGKTEIAYEAARLLQGYFKDRLLWLSASAAQTFTFLTLLDEAAAALGFVGVRELPPEKKEAEVARLLDAAAALVVLDDFHLVAPDEQRRCVEFLLRRPKCSALITSREACAAEGVRNVPVTAMTPDAGRDYLDKLVAQAKNQRAFADLAQDIMDVTESNPLLLQWVVRLLDQATDPAAALAAMKLNDGSAAERVFNYAFGLDELGEDGRAALLALSLFVVGAWRKALGQVAGIPEERLHHVIRYLADTWPARLEEGEQRVTLENLPRELLTARLASDARAALLRVAFVSYFLQYAESHARTVSEDLDALESERDNLLRAMSLASGAGDRASVLRLRELLDEFLYLHGHWGEALESAQMARSAARSAGDELNAERSALMEARIRLHRAQFHKVKETCERARPVFERLGSVADVARVLNLSGDLAARQGEHEREQSFYREAMKVQERCGDEAGLIKTLNSLGKSLLSGPADRRAEATEEAARCFERSRALEEAHVNHYSRAVTLNGLARIASEHGDRTSARALYEESLRLDKSLGNRRGVAINLQCLGTLSSSLGDMAKARRYFEQSLEIKQSINDPRGSAITKLSLGDVAEKAEVYDEAQRWWSEARDEFRAMGLSNKVRAAQMRLTRIENLTTHSTPHGGGALATAPAS